jgi:hypothetical protein
MDITQKKSLIKAASEAAFAAYTAAQGEHETASRNLVELKGQLANPPEVGPLPPRVAEIQAELARLDQANELAKAPFVAELATFGEVLDAAKTAKKSRNGAYTTAIATSKRARAKKLALKKQWDTLRKQYNDAAGKGIVPDAVVEFVPYVEPTTTPTENDGQGTPNNSGT